jgi:hypothetical protein
MYTSFYNLPRQGNQYTYFHMSAVEIICRNCGADSLLNREAIYDGFAKIGEKLICSSCGFEYADHEDIPYKIQKADPVIFTEADRSEKIEIFTEADRSANFVFFDVEENKRLCRYCANYTVNPFTQFCATHKKEVQSTDTCNRFEEAIESDDTVSPI